MEIKKITREFYNCGYVYFRTMSHSMLSKTKCELYADKFILNHEDYKKIINEIVIKNNKEYDIHLNVVELRRALPYDDFMVITNQSFLDRMKRLMF